MLGEVLKAVFPYLEYAAADRLKSMTACSVVVVWAVVLMLLSVVYAMPMEIPCSWPVLIRSN